MLMQLSGILTAQQLSHFRNLLDQGGWVNGRISAGSQSARAKNNSQLPDEHPVSIELGRVVLSELERNTAFMNAAFPLKVFPPLFNRHEKGQAYGWHFDSAVRQGRNSAERLRTDLSATLFLNAPEEYEGGELEIEGTSDSGGIKLPAGSIILYPSGALHQVRPIRQGVRYAAVLWIQSMLRDPRQLELLFNLDQAIRVVTKDIPDSKAILPLTGIYHSLLRRWAEC